MSTQREELPSSFAVSMVRFHSLGRLRDGEMPREDRDDKFAIAMAEHCRTHVVRGRAAQVVFNQVVQIPTGSDGLMVEHTHTHFSVYCTHQGRQQLFLQGDIFAVSLDGLGHPVLHGRCGQWEVGLYGHAHPDAFKKAVEGIVPEAGS